jgi:hypothetical protein
MFVPSCHVYAAVPLSGENDLWKRFVVVENEVVVVGEIGAFGRLGVSCLLNTLLIGPFNAADCPFLRSMNMTRVERAGWRYAMNC